MIPDFIIVILIMASFGATIITVANLPRLEKLWGILPFMIMAGLSFWLYEACQRPFGIKREVICELTTIKNRNGSSYQIIKDGDKIYNITAEKTELYDLSNKAVKLTYYDDTRLGIINVINQTYKPTITIVDKPEE